VASAESERNRRTHFFLPKDCSCQKGKVLDRTRYPTGLAKRVGQLDWYRVSNPDQNFLSSFPDCLLLAAPKKYPTVTTELEGQWRTVNTQESRGVKNQSRGTICRVTGTGTLENQGRILSPFTSFTNSAIITCDHSVDPSTRINALFAASSSN